MKTFAKIVGGVVAVIIVLLVAAAIVLPLIFDPNDHKGRLEAAVKEYTGRDLSIPGDIRLTVFPWLGVEMGTVELGNPPGFSAKTFARTEELRVRLKLMPLLSRRVEMDTVTVRGLVLNLERKADGSTNLDDLGGGKKTPGQAGAPPPAGEAGLASIAIGGLDVRDGAVSWKDAQTGQSYQVSHLRAQTGALAPGKPVEMELSFDVAGGTPPMKGTVELSGTLASDLQTQVHKLSELEIKTSLHGSQFPEEGLNARVAGNLTADLSKQTADVGDLKITVGDLAVSGGLAITRLASDPAYKGAFEVARFDAKRLMRTLALPPVETADEKALGAVSMRFELAGTSSHAALDPLQVQVDDTTVKGRAEVADFKRGALRFDLSADDLDADRYLPPKPAGAAPPAAGAAGGAGAAIPVQALRALDAAGTVKVGKLKVANLKLADVLLTLKAQGGLLRLHPMSAKLYDGTYAGDVRVDARGKVPALSVDEKLAGVQAGPLLADLQGIDRLTGQAAVSAELKSAGQDVAAMKRALNGRIRFDFTDGAVKGFNVNQMLREARAKLTGGSAGGGGGPNQTDFSELGGTVLVRDGVATNDDLAAKSPFLRVGGKGQADLVQETVDYRLTVTVVGSSAGQGGKELADLAGIDVPVRITGTFSEPKYGLDFEALAAAFAKSKAGALVEQQKEAIEKKASEAVSSKIGGVLGGATGESGSKEGTGATGGAGKLGGALKGLLGK